MHNVLKYIFIIIILSPIQLNDCRGVNGGLSCAVCTVVVGVFLQIAQIHDNDIFNTWKDICDKLPNIIKNPCLDMAEKFEPYIDDLETMSPDLFCLIYGTCKVDKGQPLCHLFPSPFKDELPEKYLEEVWSELMLKHNVVEDMVPKIDFCELPVIDDLCRILNNSFHSLNAVEDYDQDGFSYLSTARGSDWRGKDCADNDPQIYPGRKPWEGDMYLDNNCNGIWGIDNKTQKSYEELFCDGYEHRGIIYIGDSIGAHFHMPLIWIDPSLFQFPSLNGSNIILNEIDWPQYSFVNGYKGIPNNIWINGSVDSIYLRLRARNRCNHRDYQNLSQNGASSYEGIGHTDSVSRNQSTDLPAVVFYAMQGNDVCNNFNNTVEMTTPPKIFRKNVMKSLSILDKKLPANSHVVLIGLVHADFIYEAMARRLHPIGKLHKNVYYDDLYNWFNCLQIGPCNGWLNSNATLRSLISKKAQILSDILKDIAENEKFNSFKLHFIENPIDQVVAHRNISIPEFLEPVDSLHPNQDAQPLLAEAVWNSLPEEVKGPVNPNNEKIITLFGDQGGH